MSDIAIQAERLSKHYQIGDSGYMHNTLRDHIVHGVKSLFQRNGANKTASSIIWALQDASIEVKRGEVIGLIGRNGAGKSTLLKILSRITEPTSGHAMIYGRMGSLLEIGTGFHSELTGRENIYLSGAILGMTKREIDRKFDEIVSFAEIDKFIDTPVKRYSSGMYMRLAFAVAAHLETEILLVDEVLAVGDAAFQKKCLGRMEEAATKQGRTVVLVSHNMAAVAGLCQRAILLDGGRVVANGASEEVINTYVRRIGTIANVPLAERVDRKGDQSLHFVGLELRDAEGTPVPCVCSGQDVTLALMYQCPTGRPLRNVHVAIGMHGRYDERLFHLSTSVNGFDFDTVPSRGVILCRIPRLPLQPGRYTFNLYCEAASGLADWIANAGLIDVEAGNFFGTGRLPPPDQGSLIVEHSWTVAAIDSMATTRGPS